MSPVEPIDPTGNNNQAKPVAPPQPPNAVPPAGAANDRKLTESLFLNGSKQDALFRQLLGEQSKDDFKDPVPSNLNLHWLLEDLENYREPVLSNDKTPVRPVRMSTIQCHQPNPSQRDYEFSTLLGAGQITKAQKYSEMLAKLPTEQRLAHTLIKSDPQRALQLIKEISDRNNLSFVQQSALVFQTAEAKTAQGFSEQANALVGLHINGQLEQESRIANLPPAQRALRAMDYANDALEKGYGQAATQLLTNEASRAREAARKIPAESIEAIYLNTFADNAEARVAALRESYPQRAEQAALKLNQVARRTLETAQTLEMQGHGAEAQVLKAMAVDSDIQAQAVENGAKNSRLMVNLGVVNTYRFLANHIFDKEINQTSTWGGLRTGPRDALVADKQKANAVFDEIQKRMIEQDLPFDRVWSQMFEERSRAANSPAPVPGFFSANDAASFIRDHRLLKDKTSNMLGAFFNLSRALNAGDEKGIDQARGEIVKQLQDQGQWDIAGAVKSEYRRILNTGEGRRVFNDIDNAESGKWWKQKAGDFLEKELPVIILTGAISGGVGWGAKALATAARFGPRAAAAIGFGADVLASVPTQRLLDEVVNGRKADWSAWGMGRDYLITLGSIGLFKAAGRGWSALRGKLIGPSPEMLARSGSSADELMRAARVRGEGDRLINMSLEEAKERIRAELAAQGVSTDKLIVKKLNSGDEPYTRLTGKTVEIGLPMDKYGKVRAIEAFHEMGHVPIYQKALKGDVEARKAIQAAEHAAAEFKRLKQAVGAQETQLADLVQKLKGQRSAAAKQQIIDSQTRLQQLQNNLKNAEAGYFNDPLEKAARMSEYKHTAGYIDDLRQQFRSRASYNDLKDGLLSKQQAYFEQAYAELNRPKNWDQVKGLINQPAVPGKTNLPDGYHWHDGNIQRNPNKAVDKDFAPLSFDKTTGMIVLREASGRISNPTLMRNNFKAAVETHFTAQGLTGAQLQKAVQKELDRVQIHHLIPDEAVRNHPLAQAARERAGYDLDRGNNLIGLAKSAGDKHKPGDVGHWTSHPKYTDEVMDELTKTQHRLERIHKKGIKDLDPNLLKQEMQHIEDKFRQKIEKGNVPTKDGRLALKPSEQSEKSYA